MEPEVYGKLVTDQWQEDKGLMAKSGPTHFRCCTTPQCPMAPRSLFSKVPAPPTPKVRNAQAFRVEGGAEVSGAAEGVAPDSEEVVPGVEGRTPRLRSECLVTLISRHRQVKLPRPCFLLIFESKFEGHSYVGGGVWASKDKREYLLNCCVVVCPTQLQLDILFPNLAWSTLVVSVLGTDIGGH